MSTALTVFLCPSDAANGDLGWSGGTNYRVNLGADRWDTLNDKPTNGPLMSYKCGSLSAISDGLSNTVAFGEKLRGRVQGSSANPRTDMFFGGLGSPSTADEAFIACSNGLDATKFVTPSGLAWSVGTLSQTSYNHVIGPNSTTPDCILPISNPISGLIGARSNHPGGVQAAMADGSVRFFTNAIDRQVWKAVGTRAGGEVVSRDGL